MKSAIVFAYHNVGVRCLATLLAHGVEVRLVVTHERDPNEQIWFDSVAALAELHGIPVITPANVNDSSVIDAVRNFQADLIFSFYYRQLLDQTLLDCARIGAYNMHGSLLPKYRGRAPVNWAVLHGESVTGATLHRMVARADAGEIVAQQSVPILPNDTAHDVFQKVAVAAEVCLSHVLPDLLRGQAAHRSFDMAQSSYFGRRTPEDGRIQWSQGAWQIHNLIRAVAPPYPGAFFDYRNQRIFILRSHFNHENASSAQPRARIYWHAGKCHADCTDGKRFRILQLSINGQTINEQVFMQHFGAAYIEPETDSI